MLLTLRDEAKNVRGRAERYKRIPREAAALGSLVDGTSSSKQMEQTQEPGSCARWCQPSSPQPLLPSLTLSHKTRPYEKKARDGVRLFGFAQHQYLLKPKHLADVFVWPCQRITRKMATFEFHLPKTVPILSLP